MTTITADEKHHPVVAPDRWLEQRRSLLAREKELTRLRDEIAAERRTLPWVRIDKPYVFEAVSTVRYTPLAQWTARGDGGHYVAKRLRNADALLTPGAVARLHAGSADYEGRPYDLTFEWSDQRIYCSELVWKLYQRALGVRIGELQKIRSFNLDDPAVRAKMRERYGDKVPMDEPVISPVAMFDSPLLTTVETR